MVNSSYILEKLQGNPKERKAAIQLLVYNVHLKSRIIGLLIKKGANQEEAITIYHDSIMALVKTGVKRTKTIANIEHYMIGIAKYKWYDVLRAKTSNRNISADIDDQIAVDEHILTKILTGERQLILREILTKMKVNCKEVLLYWSAGYNMQEIADRLMYKSAGVVRKKKRICLKQLIDYISDKPLLKESLKP